MSKPKFPLFISGSWQTKDLFDSLKDGEYKIRVYQYDNEELGIHERRVNVDNLAAEAQEYAKAFHDEAS